MSALREVHNPDWTVAYRRPGSQTTEWGHAHIINPKLSYLRVELTHAGQAPADDTGGLVDLIVIETASHCIKEAEEATGLLGADSGAVETVRYE